MKTLEKVNIPQSLWTISKSNYLNSLNTTYNQKMKSIYWWIIWNDLNRIINQKIFFSF